jgi:hypothetical protein
VRCTSGAAVINSGEVEFTQPRVAVIVYWIRDERQCIRTACYGKKNADPLPKMEPLARFW